MIEAIQVVLMVYIFVSWLGLCIEQQLFHNWVKAHGIPLPWTSRGAPGVALRKYRRWCTETGRHPNEARLSRYRVWRYNSLASLVAFLLAFVLFVVQQRALDRAAG